MAMKPFCGYNFADYWNHWLSFDEKSNNLPEIFHVNWFRQDSDDNFLWPGFGDNLRVLQWIVDRCEGRVDAKETPIGFLPNDDGIDTTGLDLDPATMSSLLNVDAEQWRAELNTVGEYFDEYGDRLPEALRNEQKKALDALG